MFTAALALAPLAACGDDAPADDVDSGITLFDAPPEIPDAAGPPDAFVCSENNCDNDCCDNVCIDTTADDLNCGACDNACTVGTHCENDGAESACGECPPGFVPASVSDPDGQVLDLEPFADLPLYAGFSQYQDPVEAFDDGFGVLYGKGEAAPPLDEAIPLTVGFTFPQVLAVYDGNLLAQSYDTAYGANSGTVTFTRADATCVSGSLAGVTFEALDGTLPPSVADDGCSFTVEAMDFAIGDCGGEVTDGGPA